MRTGLVVCGVVILLGAGFVTIRLWTALHAISPHSSPTDLLVALAHAQTDEPGSLGWKIKHDERINILLLGYGGPGHDGAYLTDSIMLVSVKGASRQAVMISLPRDLWVRIPALPNNGFMSGKLNNAYAIGTDHRNYPNVRAQWKTDTGGGDLAAATISQITHQHVDYWVGVDFKAFRDLVNALAGVQLNIPTALDDPYYPAGETTGYMHIHLDAGPQQLDGEHALQYARSRETTSDFDRSRRQQAIMLAVRQKALSVNALPHLFQLLSALQHNVRTNLRPQDMQLLAELAGQIKEADIRHIGIDSSNLLRSTFVNGQYVLLPRDPTYAMLQRYLDLALPDRAELAARVPFQIQDGSRRYWLPYAGTPAKVMTGLLQNIGWNATQGPSAPLVAQTQIRDGSGGTAAAMVAWLQQYFKATVVVVPAPSSGPAISVVLGSDFTAKAFPVPLIPATPRPSSSPSGTPTGTPSSPVSPTPTATASILPSTKPA
jgi:LCP family protein required for cell wall assembly